MTYDLIHYFNQKFDKLYRTESKKTLPFITLSRETGCGANAIALMLQEELTSREKKWNVINKEIIDEAASQLKVDRHRIYDVINARNRTMADEILNALSTRYYKNDRILRKSITEIVRHDAQTGNIIIVGRGGVAVTQDLPMGMHIKLMAPVKWRVENVMKMRGMTENSAMEYIDDIDKKRKQLLKQLSGNKFNNSWFNLVINCATFTPLQIVRLISDSMKMRQLL